MGAQDEFELNVVKVLGFTASNKATRVHRMHDPTAGVINREDA